MCNIDRLVYLQKRIFSLILEISDSSKFSDGKKYQLILRVECILVYIDTSFIEHPINGKYLSKDSLDFVEEKLAEIESIVFS